MNLIDSILYLLLMADLNIPNINKKSDKYLFKNKISQSRKSKRRLLGESFFMLMLSFLLFYLNYLIPNKSTIFSNFLINIGKSFSKLIDLFSSIFQLLIVIFIISSLIIAAILFIGSLYRIIRLVKRKSKSISYR